MQVGSLAGSTLALDSAWLRSSGVELLGSGIGSVTPARLLAAAGEVVDELAKRSVTFTVRTVPLAEVETAWDRPAEERLVFLP